MRIFFMVLILIFSNLLKFASLYAQIPAFPGAEGFGAFASGGRGGQVIYVTNLNLSGPGSLQAAINTPGPKYILFKVSGVIQGTVEIPVGGGNFTLAGQTSPNGIILRGLLAYNDENPTAENMVIRHIRSRLGNASLYPPGGWMAEDGLTLGGVRNTIIDHCSFAHATDEAVDISRSSRITIQNCILAETLGSHFDLGGMLINYSSPQSRLDSLSIHHNIWNRIGGRMPEISCESPACQNQTIRIEMSNNLLWDQNIQVWYDPASGGPLFYLDANIVGNVGIGRPTYGGPLFNYNFLEFSQNDLYVQGNFMPAYPNWSDYQLFYCCNDFNQFGPNSNMGTANALDSRHPFPAITYTSQSGLLAYMMAHAGAQPRDSMDRRLMKYVGQQSFDPTPLNLSGANDPFIIQGNAVAPIDTDNDGMPDSWEISYGLNPNFQDHNGTDLSVGFTGMAGYTNLECYLFQLAGDPVTPVAVPVELSSFSAETKSDGVHLLWRTERETDNKGFSIQRKTGNEDFVTIGWVSAGSGNGINYRFRDHNPPSPAWLYYRLRQEDYDGQFAWSEVRSVQTGIERPEFALYPNPAVEWLRIKSTNAVQGPYHIMVYDVWGQLVFQTYTSQPDMDIDVRNWAKTTYALRITGNGINFQRTFQMQ
jgi:pectate lyase